MQRMPVTGFQGSESLDLLKVEGIIVRSIDVAFWFFFGGGEGFLSHHLQMGEPSVKLSPVTCIFWQLSFFGRDYPT